MRTVLFGGLRLRLAGWLVGWLVGWLSGWLSGWLTFQVAGSDASERSAAQTVEL